MIFQDLPGNQQVNDLETGHSCHSYVRLPEGLVGLRAWNILIESPVLLGKHQPVAKVFLIFFVVPSLFFLPLVAGYARPRTGKPSGCLPDERRGEKWGEDVEVGRGFFSSQRCARNALCIWVNYNDLTATSLESWLGFGKSSPNGLNSG